MTSGTPIHACPSCGRSISPAMPEGLCPACLVAMVVGEEETALRPPLLENGEDLGGMRFFGDYELLEEIDRGGMGIVFKARQLGLDRIVALKVLIGGGAAGREFVHRFHNEAATTARLEHPHIVSIYEFGTHEGAHFLAMKFMEGGSLLQRIRTEAISPREATQLMIPIALAVQHAHQHGVLHRDLKPGNILLDEEGRPCVADFGLASLFGDESNLTLSEAIIGTAGYLSPEIARGGAGQATIASDIYGLGAILYELLSGRPPFSGEGIIEVLRQVQEDLPATPGPTGKGDGNHPVVSSFSNSSSLRDLQIICLKCLEKNPARRYATAGDLAEDLRRVLHHEPVQARSIGWLERSVQWCRRRPAIASLTAALLVAFGSGLAGTWWQLQETRRYALESQHQIARLNTLTGVHLLQTGDPFRSLLWFTEALRIKEAIHEETAIDRQRVTSILAHGPQLVAVITHAGQPLADAAFHPVREEIATVGRDRRVRLWKIPAGEPGWSTEPFANRPTALTYSPDGSRLLVASSEFNQIQLLSAGTGELLTPPMPHFAGGAANRPLPARFDSTGDRLVTQMAPQILQVWRAEDASAIGREIKLPDPITWISFAPQGNRILTWNREGTIMAWDWRSGAEAPVPQEFQTEDANLSPANEPGGLTQENLILALSPRGDRYATLTPDRRVQVRDRDTDQPVTPPMVHHHRTGPVQFSASGRYLLTIHPAGAALVWDLESSFVPPVLLRPEPPAALAETGRDGAIAATLEPYSPVRVRLAPYSQSPSISLHPSSLQDIPVQAWFNESGQFIILEYPGQTAQIWHAETGLPVTPRFQSQPAADEPDYLEIHFPRPPLLPVNALLAIAELMAGEQLDGTGGWEPLGLHTLVDHWNLINQSVPRPL